MKRNYKEMTVTELRAETRRRGLPQQKNGKKFVKAELVERLEQDDKQDDMKFGASEEERETKKKTKKKWEKPEVVITKVEKKQEVTIEQVTSEITKLQEKYCGSVKAACVNGFCVYVTYTEAKDGRVLKRATKGIVRKVLDEGIILVESKKGITCTLSVSSLLFYKDEDERKGYPDDIEEVFRMQEKEFRSYMERMKKCGEWKEK